MVVNNVTRLLDARKIEYKAYELPIEKLGAKETARLLGVDPMLVYKTIVVRREKGKPILAVIPGPNRVSLKSLASVLGEKKLTLPTESDAEKMSGLQSGGISPLALLNKGFEVVISFEAVSNPEMNSLSEDLEIHVSGGQRGLNIRLSIKALVGLTNARLAAISFPEGELIC